MTLGCNGAQLALMIISIPALAVTEFSFPRVSKSVDVHILRHLWFGNFLFLNWLIQKGNYKNCFLSHCILYYVIYFSDFWKNWKTPIWLNFIITVISTIVIKSERLYYFFFVIWYNALLSTFYSELCCKHIRKCTYMACVI